MSSFCRNRAWTRLFLCLLAACSATLPALPGRATTVVRLSDAELVTSARLIVTGECLDTRAMHLADRIVTLATVRVGSVLADRGTAVARGDTVTVVLPGGVDLSGPLPLAEVWPGAPDLQPSRPVLLFLRRFAPVPGGWSIVGYSQGMFTLSGPAAAADGVVARRDLSGVRLVEREGSAHPVAGEGRSEPLAYWRRLVDELGRAGEGR